MTGLTPVSITFLVFPNVTQLDLTGPAQVLSRLGDVTLNLVWKDLNPVATDAGFALLPTATFDDVSSADILCVPGGLGTLDIMEDQDVLSWLRKIAENAQWVTSVCAGSLVLGAAGLLKGYRSTCHWASIDQLSCFGAVPVKERVVFDRNRASGGGVTSGIDFGLALAAKIRGESFAKFIQLSLEYDPHPPFDAGSPDKADENMLAQYWAMIEKTAPHRRERVAAMAKRLGFESGL